MCPVDVPLTSFPRKKRPARTLGQPFPDRANLVFEAGGSRQHKGWTVVDAVASCPDPA